MLICRENSSGVDDKFKIKIILNYFNFKLLTNRFILRFINIQCAIILFNDYKFASLTSKTLFSLILQIILKLKE